MVIKALPGMGKTALVCRWAESAQDAFPDGQLFVDFGSRRHGAGADVSGALAMCLRALGVSDAFMPSSLEERANELRSRTAGKRLLIVLGDVSQPAQVRPLVPKGRGSVLLATSHRDLRDLVLDGAEVLPLEPMGEESGLELLADFAGRAIAPAERPLAERLVALCGGLPVALRVLGSRLARNRRLTFGALVAELDDENRRLKGMNDGGEHSVSAVLGLAYRELPPAEAQVYRLLGWLPGRTFDAGTAAAALGTAVEQVGPLLDGLVDASLLSEEGSDRYRFHDLVRLHAREQAEREEPEGARRAVLERVTTHFLALTALADRAIREERLRIADLSELLSRAEDPFAGEGGPPPLDWLAAERDSIMAVLREASRAELHELVWPLGESFTVLFLHRRDVRAWWESLELAIASAVALGETDGEARLRSLLSRPLLDLDEDERAKGELELAEQRAQSSDRAVLRASVAEFSGRYWDRHDPARAIEAYRRSLALNMEAGEKRGAAIAAFFLGRAQDAAREHHAALATLEKAHADLLALDEADERMAARVQAALGAVHEHLGNDQEAAVRLRQAAATLNALGAGHYEGETLVRLAELLERTGGDPVAVRECVARASGIWEEIGHPQAARLQDWLTRLDG
ncbi:NB-ARC domain-containing protein [Streptomyces sp. NBRC 109706]|uniref:NB-ARC domain-containing protein n=1 Tax=Streptomyces sp. NBRC 109706 TaxID=1550035 RepID=UPI001F39D2EA|nr:NB-ARC domain-containing protein [Streptomyces sp. NBRC 109706]